MRNGHVSMAGKVCRALGQKIGYVLLPTQAVCRG